MNKELHGVIEYVKSIRSRIEGVFEWLKGGTEITTTSQLRVAGAVGVDVGFRARSSNGTGDVYTGVGSGGVNHGVYSWTMNRWMVYSDGTYTWFDNNDGGNFRWDMSTNNTTDTWVPVLRNGALQHRVIPLNYNRVPNVGSAQGTSSEQTRTGTGFTTICTMNYTTYTGRFMILGRAVIKTSRYTSAAQIHVDGSAPGYHGTTNSTSFVTVNPVAYKTATPSTSHTVSLVITAQDSGTTCTSASYSYPYLLIFDIP